MARKLQAEEVAKSAEKQLMDLQSAKADKIKSFINDRNDIVNMSRAVQTIMYAVATTYKEVFPGAEGFIELRIKSLDSLETKAINDFTEILNDMKLAKGTDQKEVLDRIKDKKLKDILAFTVVTTKPPEKFKTGNDELNKKLLKLANELRETDDRIQTHKEFIDSNERKMRELDNEITELKSEMSLSDELDDLINDLDDIISSNKKSTKGKDEIEQLKKLVSENSKKMHLAKLKDRTEQHRLMEENVEYGETNLSRTKKTYGETLRELQHEMSAYFVSNLENFSTFKYWGAKQLEDPKLIEKPGFRTMKATYNIGFSGDILGILSTKTQIGFEAQGKGELDYNDSEFNALGAIYHEEQKTKDGIISKKTDMPDFTIIGDKQTRKIEESIRRKYAQILSINDLIQLSDDPKLTEAYKELKGYEEKITQEMASKYGDNYSTNGKIKSKMNKAFEATKENLIQKEIEEKINQSLDEFADSESVKARIEKNDELKKVYEKRLKELKKSGLGKQEIEHEARLKVIYYAKERSILEYANRSIPIFSRANIANDPQEPVIYTFTVGESVYRYFYNKLNGLKDENGNYKFPPQEQQKRALLKLSGLFALKPDGSNFYTYNQRNKKFGPLGGGSGGKKDTESLDLNNNSDDFGELE